MVSIFIKFRSFIQHMASFFLLRKIPFWVCGGGNGILQSHRESTSGALAQEDLRFSGQMCWGRNKGLPQVHPAWHLIHGWAQLLLAVGINVLW